MGNKDEPASLSLRSSLQVVWEMEKAQQQKWKRLKDIKHRMYMEHSDDSILSWKGQIFDEVNGRSCIWNNSTISDNKGLSILS